VALTQSTRTRSAATVAKVIALINRKGGVGKTTTTANLAAALALLGHRILAIDLDTQKASLSTWLGCGTDTMPENGLELADALVTPTKAPLAIYPSTIKGVDIMPCGPRTVASLSMVENRPAPDRMLDRVIAALDQPYDFILLDCPSALSRVVMSAIIAADEIIMPVRPHTMSLDAVAEMLQIVEEVEDAQLRTKPNPPKIRPLITEPDNSRLGKAAIENVRENLEHVFATPIRRNIKLAEAYGQRKSIFEYAPRSAGASDYRDIVNELIGVAR
jgi:chromosome partitioning protein